LVGLPNRAGKTLRRNDIAGGALQRRHIFKAFSILNKL